MSSVRSSADFLAGGGEMGALIRAHDWRSTPLGAVEHWPQSLRTAVGILLNSGYPMYIGWGPRFVQLYNDAYRPILGSTKHPRALGACSDDTFAEIWDFIGPMFRDVMATGRASTFSDQLLGLDRHGYPEECYFTFSYSAIPDEAGGVGGVFVTVIETTERMLRERRLRALRDLLEVRNRESLAAICAASAEALHRNLLDAPFALLYALEPSGAATLAGCAGLEPGGALAPVRLEPGGASPWPLDVAVGEVRRLALPAALPGGSPWPEPVVSAACVGVATPGRPGVQALLVAGLSPRLAFSGDYAEYLRAAAANVGTVVAESEALAHEKRRAEALAQLDRAKTVFFSDVSHEFRTPLTLMMGPLEEALAASAGPVRENLEIAHRNTLRLLKLVNSLLDFSRIEAGRLRADRRPTDLAALTADVASNFRSAIEHAGLRFEVDCPPFTGALEVDPDMWEKIVLNLVSNAFRHTFEGRIRVSLREADGMAVLEVSDTGIGIPQAEQPHVFERFRRVQNARARSHEGSGIGLALVRSLVQLHGGTVELRSREGAGTIFTVAVPAMRAAPGPAAAPAAPAAPGACAARAFVEEALRWLPDASAGSAPRAGGARILVADDNADMREYLRRILAGRWTVQSCGDGLEALRIATEDPPDLLISDVMMPGIDGFELIARLRQSAATAHLPVILLSARAGEESRVEGLQAGADDYLVKPFSVRDLIARVESQLARSGLAAREREQAARLARLFEQAPVGIVVLRGPEHTFEIANPCYLALLADRPVLGLPIRTALPELEGQGYFERLDEVYRTGKPYVGRSEGMMLARGGRMEEVFFDFVYQPIGDAGVTDGILVACFEVTELVRARRAAEEANAAKDEFLAMLGHELRNPLAPILTALQLMRMRDSAAHEREREVIQRQVAHLVGLVDDLLDVSRVTRGMLELRRRRVEASEIVAKAVEQAAPLFEQRHHHLEIDVPDAGLVLDADPRRLAQVVTNLLTNAAKYTPSGGRIALRARAADGGFELRVRDDGVGIEADQLPRLFDRFFQARQAPDRSQGGLGLGLAIVKSLVELHGGAVGASSEGRDRGSEFTVRLPLAAGAAGATRGGEAKVAALPERRRVLIVDDNEDAGETLAGALAARGHEVRHVCDAPEAFAAIGEFRPDVAVLDIGLPAMDGYELAQRLRELPAGRGVRLVAVTGYGQAEDRERSRLAGFAAHLVKPVSVEDVEAALAATDEAPLAAQEPGAAAPDP